MQNEIWREIEDSYYYAISNKGRIKRLAHQTWCVLNNCYSNYKGRVLKASNKNTKKYWRIRVEYKDGTARMESIHRLVAKAFILNVNNYPQVNHKDCDKNNNNVENLEWCDNSYNQRHAIASGVKDVFFKSIEGEKSHLNKYPEELIRKIPEYIEQGFSYNKTAKILGIPPTLITEIKFKRTWKHLNITIPDSKVYKRKI